MLVLESLLLHTSAAVGAAPPVVHRCLIASDVDVARGEELHHLAEDILYEAEGLLLADTQIRALEVPTSPTAQLGVGGEDLVAMPGHLDLGDHGDA